MNMNLYITTGVTRGACGHRHHTLEAAFRCLESGIVEWKEATDAAA